MRHRTLIALAVLSLGLAAPASAQKRFELTLGTRGVSIGARLPRASIHVGYGSTSSRARHGYISSRHYTHRVWVPGHYVTVYERVWIPGSKRKVWIEPIYETRCDAYGRTYSVLVQPGSWQWVETKGYYEERPVKKWIPSCYQTRSY